MGWFADTMGWIGKAIPNEFQKLSSVARYVPYVGQAVQGLGAVDSFATAYDDVRDQGGSQGDAWGTAIKQGISGYQGSQDPGVYGSPGDNVNRDWANWIGQFGNLIPTSGGGASGYSQLGSGLMGLASNPYITGEGQVSVEGYKQPNKGGFVGDLLGGYNPQLYVAAPQQRVENRNYVPQLQMSPSAQYETGGYYYGL